MTDFENISKDPLDKFNELKLYGVIYLDRNTKLLTFNSKDTISILPKEFETIHNYYRKYKNKQFGGGNCVSCKVQELENIRKGFEKFLEELKIKYFGGE